MNNRFTKLVSWLAAGLFIILLFPSCQKAGGQLSKKERQLNLESFETVWTTIRDKHYDPKLGGLDWQAVHDELLPKMNQAKTQSEARRILNDMVGRLKQSHFQIVPGYTYEGVDRPGASKEKKDGVTGIDVRLIDNQVTVTKVESGTPAAGAGIKPGWIVVKAGEIEIQPLLEKLSKEYEGRTLKELMMTFTVISLLKGNAGETIAVDFLDLEGEPVSKEFVLIRPKGKQFKLGTFDFGYVWIEKRELENNTGYIAFNGFLDIGTVIPVYNKAIMEFMEADGLIIDIRGNPGGLGGMAMGMAGWFFEEKGKSLGQLMTRQGALKFAILPRPTAYKGPLAILVDSLSASTSEIFAAGLQDLGRARVFGELTAGAALPSVIATLPNGDFFQYAIADYTSTGGKTLEGLGVKPDQEIPLTRQSVIEGKDPVLEAAIQWLQTQKEKKK